MLRDEVIDPDHIYNEYYTAKLLFGHRRMDEKQRLHALRRYVDRGFIRKTGGGFRGWEITATRIKQFKRKEEVSRRLNGEALKKLDEIIELTKKNQKAQEKLLQALVEAVSEMKELRAERAKGEDWKK